MRSRNVHVQLWLNEKEAAMLKKNVKAAGITQSAYLRHLIKGFVPKEHPPLDYFSFMRSLYSLANNLNQIAQKAHGLGVIDERVGGRLEGVSVIVHRHQVTQPAGVYQRDQLEILHIERGRAPGEWDRNKSFKLFGAKLVAPSLNFSNVRASPVGNS